MAKRQRRTQGASTEGAGGAGAPTPAGGIPSLPLWVPALVFVGLTVLLFRDFVFSDQMLYGGDTLALGYVARAFYAEALTELGMFPRWAPELLGGTPFLEALSAEIPSIRPLCSSSCSWSPTGRWGGSSFSTWGSLASSCSGGCDLWEHRVPPRS